MTGPPWWRLARQFGNRIEEHQVRRPATKMEHILLVRLAALEAVLRRVRQDAQWAAEGSPEAIDWRETIKMIDKVVPT